jgi:hypothetical protein
MAINYYLVPYVSLEDKEVLMKYGLKVNPLHVGKTYRGWRFLFNIIIKGELYPYMGVGSDINSYHHMREVITSLVGDNKCTLQDEYHQEITPSDFFQLVENDQQLLRHEGNDYTQDAEGYSFNKCHDWC